MKKITTIILLILSMQGYSQQTIKVAGGGTSGGATKYSTTEYGMLTDSATTNLYKFRADTTVLESQARAVNRAALKQNVLTNPITGTGTIGQIPYWNGTSTQTGSSNLIWDNTNERIGIGLTPTNKIDISASQPGDMGIKITNTSTTSAASANIRLENNGGSNGRLFKTGTGYAAYKTLLANDLGFYNAVSGNISILNDFATGNIFLTAGAASEAQVTLLNSGNLLVGTTTNIASSKLTVGSTTQGFLPPRMTATQASAIASPAEGLLVYVTNTNGTFTSKGWWGWSGAAWEKLNN